MTSLSNRSPVQVTVTETTPLNSSLIDNIKRNPETMDAETKSVLFKIATDVILLCCGMR